MKSILRSLAVLAVVVGFAGSSFAQDTNNDIIRPITKSGSAAFIFTIGGLGTFNLSGPALAGGKTAGFGMKYFVSDDLALRILLGLGMKSTTTTSTGATTTETTGTENGFGLGVGLEHHFRPLYSTDPYIGAQLGFASFSTDNGGEDAGLRTTSESDLSIAAIMGFNWFFTRGISVGAEYSLGFTSHSSSEKNGTADEADGPSISNIGFGGVGSVNLNVFF